MSTLHQPSAGQAVVVVVVVVVVVLVVVFVLLTMSVPNVSGAAVVFPGVPRSYSMSNFVHVDPESCQINPGSTKVAPLVCGRAT